MRRDFLEYLPVIVIALLIISAFGLFEKGFFKENKNRIVKPNPTPIIILKTDPPKETLSPSPTETPTDTPTAMPKPSINGRFGGGEDD